MRLPRFDPVFIASRRPGRDSPSKWCALSAWKHHDYTPHGKTGGRNDTRWLAARHERLIIETARDAARPESGH